MSFHRFFYMGGIKMIIGLVGPAASDTQLITELLTEEKSIQVVDSIDVIRLMDRKHINSLTTKDYHKKYFLKQLESELGTYIVTGNLLLSQEICQWILQDGGIIVVISRDKMESYDKSVIENTGVYWDDPNIQRYELEYKFKRLFEELQKSNDGSGNLYLVDLSDEDSEDLNQLVECSQEWMDSEHFSLSAKELVSIVTRKEDNHMTMEESIKQAMRELGVEVDDEPTQQDKPVEKPKTIEKKQKPVKKVTQEPIMEPTDVETEVEGQMTLEEFENDSAQEESEENNSVFVKLTDTTMALLLPVGLQLEKQSIGGMEFNVATVSVPDWESRKLQELELKTEKQPELKTQAKTKPVETKTKTPKSVEKKPIAQESVKIVVESGDLKELQEEKARLDAEIKKYRAEGDMDTVNALRKQRRAVRGKINSLK